jgi:hypothetical protein
VAGRRRRVAKPRGEGHDRRRVEPAAEARPHVHVAAEAEPDGVGEQVADLAGVAGDRGRLRQRVPAADVDRARAEVEAQPMAAGYAVDPLIERALSLVERAVDEEAVEGGFVGPAGHCRVGEEPLDLGGEGEQAPGGVVVERLHAEAVAGA